MEYTLNEIKLPNTEEVVTYITKLDNSGATTFIQDEENQHYKEYLVWKAEQEA